jgi:signal transduction histidine kinase
MADGTPGLLDGYRRLIEISRDLASTLELDPLLRRITDAASTITGAGAASIILYDEAAGKLYFQVASNIASAKLRGLDIPLEGSIAGWIVQHREPVRLAHPGEDPRFYNTVAAKTRYPTQSLIGVPLITREKVVGVLEVINKKSGEFNRADQDLLGVLGAQAAVAIENTRLFQQFDLISEFVHELRTPLASLATSSYLLKRPELSLDQTQRILDGIHDESLRLSTLATSFLDLARLESGRVQYQNTRFDLRGLFEDCCDLMQPRAEELQIRIEIPAPAGRLTIYADHGRLKQVLINLVSNGIKYNRKGGSLSLAGERRGREIIIRVSDTGVGIPASALPHIFEKFYRVRATEGEMGTGLGLAIVRQIVISHGGRIEVQSKLRKGTDFIIHLPQEPASRSGTRHRATTTRSRRQEPS